jgi:hypothetical protein
MSFFKKITLDSATFIDTSEPANLSVGSGALYKVPDKNTIFFKAGSGPAYDLTNSAIISTGVVSGGVISINADNTKFNITAGSGRIALHDPITPAEPSISYITWNAFSAVVPTHIATNLTTFISIDVNSAIVQSTTKPTHENRRINIFLGILRHTNNIVINGINIQVDYINEPMSQLRDLYDIIGFINISGNSMIGNTNLTVQKSTGSMASYGSNYAINNKNPHVVTLPLINTNTTGVFQYVMQNGSGSALTLTNVLPSNYDNGSAYPGTTTGSNKFTIQRWFSFTDNSLKAQLGQVIYNSMELAEAALLIEPFIVEPSIINDGLFIGYMIIKQGSTDLTDVAKVKFIKAGRFGVLSGTSGANTLQGVYDISNPNPEILINAVGGAITLRNGTVSDSSTILEIQNIAATTTSSINGYGVVNSKNVKKSVAAVLDTDKVLTITSEHYHSFAPTSARTLVLPLISTANGYSYTIVLSGGTSTLNIVPNAANTNSIEGSGNHLLSTIYDHATLSCINAIWIVSN